MTEPKPRRYTSSVPSLRPPPEFGPRGEDPPAYSEDVLVNQYYFTATAMSPDSNIRSILGYVDAHPTALSAVGQDPALIAQLDAARADLSQRISARTAPTFGWSELQDILSGRKGWPLAVLAWPVVVLGSIYTFGAGPLIFAIVAFVRSRNVSRESSVESGSSGEREVRRLRATQYWLREKQIEQLAPGTSSTSTKRFRMGITFEQSRDLSLHLGAAVAGSAWPEFAAHLAETRRTEKSYEIEKSIHLSNDRTGFYRRIALWRLVDVATIEALTSSDGLHWTEISKLEYCTSPSIATSFIDVAKADI